MPPERRTIKNYTPEAMRAAIDDVRYRKVTIRAASRKYGIPRPTLGRRVLMGTAVNGKAGPGTVLTENEEKTICEWIEYMDTAGFKVTIGELTAHVQKIIVNTKRRNPFKNNMPGKTWVRMFLQRHPHISKRISKKFAVPLSASTHVDVKSWFLNTSHYIKENNHDYVLNDPSRIFNCDEILFYLHPNGNKVLVKKKSLNGGQLNAKECVTTLLMVNACGLVAPLTLVFQCQRLPKKVTDNFPEEWNISKSDTGQMTREIFHHYVTKVFYPWLLEKEVKLPIILFLDKSTSFIDFPTTQFCQRQGIILMGLFANAKHSLQPLEVAIFQPLKENCKKKVVELRRNIPNFKKQDFSKLLYEVLDSTLDDSGLRISDSFRKCGIYPWDLSTLYTSNKDIDISQMLEEKILRLDCLKQTLKCVNEHISSEKIVEFQSSPDTWNGDMSYEKLFAVWRQIQKEIDEISTSVEDLRNISMLIEPKVEMFSDDDDSSSNIKNNMTADDIKNEVTTCVDPLSIGIFDMSEVSENYDIMNDDIIIEVIKDEVSANDNMYCD